MDRKLNALFLFVAVIVFITGANTTQQWNMLLGGVLASVFSLGVFFLARLTLDGMFAAIIVGTYTLGLGGWYAALVLILFFVSSVILSDIPNLGNTEEDKIRRDGRQVWANGFWLVIFLILSVSFNSSVFFVAAMTVIATATADTWATELGSKSTKSTYLITSFKQVSPGTDGGVSFRGTVAALLASVLIAGVTVYSLSLQISIFLIILAAGFLGCLIDSYLGAIFQQANRSVPLPMLNTEVYFSNNLVNVVSTGLGGLLAIILKLFFA